MADCLVGPKHQTFNFDSPQHYPSIAIGAKPRVFAGLLSLSRLNVVAGLCLRARLRVVA